MAEKLVISGRVAQRRRSLFFFFFSIVLSGVLVGSGTKEEKIGWQETGTVDESGQCDFRFLNFDF